MSSKLESELEISLLELAKRREQPCEDKAAWDTERDHVSKQESTELIQNSSSVHESVGVKVVSSTNGN